MPVRVEVLPYIEVVAVAAVALFGLLRVFSVRRKLSVGVATGLFLAGSVALCLFFRDPERVPPVDPGLVVN